MPDVSVTTLAVIAELGEEVYQIDWKAEYLKLYHRNLSLQREIELLTPGGDTDPPEILPE